MASIAHRKLYSWHRARARSSGYCSAETREVARRQRHSSGVRDIAFLASTRLTVVENKPTTNFTIATRQCSDDGARRAELSARPRRFALSLYVTLVFNDDDDVVVLTFPRDGLREKFSRVRKKRTRLQQRARTQHLLRRGTSVHPSSALSSLHLPLSRSLSCPLSLCSLSSFFFLRHRVRIPRAYYNTCSKSRCRVFSNAVTDPFAVNATIYVMLYRVPTRRPTPV